jgi:hypothetical protein
MKARKNERDRRLTNWHQWFAWYPIIATDDDYETYTIFWLRKIYRKGSRGILDNIEFVYCESLFDFLKEDGATNPLRVFRKW